MMRDRARRRLNWCVLCCLCLTAATPAVLRGSESPEPPLEVSASAPDPGHGKVLFSTHCRTCHGNHGWGDGSRGIPALAGQREKYLVGQLTGFVEGKRTSQSMHDTMQRQELNRPSAIRDLAAFLSGAQRSPGPENGGDPDVSAGKRLYEAACRGCHGAHGEGTQAGVPAVGGQQYRYLTEQLDNFASGHRSVGDPKARVPMGAPSARDIEELANYLAHLSYLTAGRT